MLGWKTLTVSSQLLLGATGMLTETLGKESQTFHSINPLAEERGTISIFPMLDMGKLRQ